MAPKVFAEVKRLTHRLRRGQLWTPPMDLYAPPVSKTLAALGLDPRDPKVLGYDRNHYNTLGVISQQAQLLDYAASGVDSVDLPTDRVITAIALVADPYRHDVTTAVIVPVQDAVDKVISGLTIAGGPTYFQLSSTLAYLKALSAMNKVVYGNIGHEDLATAVGADSDSYHAWYIPFGAINDHNPFDVSAGIPAEDETSLILSATFGANSIIAETAANGTVDTATDIYVVVFGVQGLSRGYRQQMPMPQFEHAHITAPTTTTRFNLTTKRYLKRTTILNLAAAASNNEARNDSNITDFSVVFETPTKTYLIDRMRWRVWKHTMQTQYRGVDADRDGSQAVAPGGLAGVAVIDWRRITHNPYGLSLYQFGKDDVHLDLTMGTTTGSVHLFNEYYNLPNPAVAEGWPAYRGQ